MESDEGGSCHTCLQKKDKKRFLEMLKVNKRVSNTELIKKFGVSGTTIRIDLTELEQKVCFQEHMEVRS